MIVFLRSIVIGGRGNMQLLPVLVYKKVFGWLVLAISLSILIKETIISAANPARGQLAYQQKCMSCHSAQGQGRPTPDGTGYTFPPLWGNHSYNTGAGLYRFSRLAGYLKANMPMGTTWEIPQLSDEEAWDLAAYINSRPRPVKDLSKDWPNLKGKPIDHPFGPFADPFSETKRKYGPFKPIEQFKKNN